MIQTRTEWFHRFGCTQNSYTSRSNSRSQGVTHNVRKYWNVPSSGGKVLERRLLENPLWNRQGNQRSRNKAAHRITNVWYCANWPDIVPERLLVSSDLHVMRLKQSQGLLTSLRGF